MVHYCSASKCKSKAGEGFSFFSFPKDETLCKAWCHAMRRENFKATIHSKLCSKHFQREDFEPLHYGNPRLKKGSVPTIFDHNPKSSGPKSRKPPVARNNPAIPESPPVPESFSSTSEFDDPTNPTLQNPFNYLVSTLQKSRKPPLARNNPAIPESPPVPESFSSISEFDDPTYPPQVKTEYSPSERQETLACNSSDTDSSLCAIEIHSIYSLAEEDSFVPGKKRCVRKSYVGDYKITDLASPTKAQKFIELITEKLKKKAITISNLKRTNKRLNGKILSMEKQINDLKRKLDINGIAWELPEEV